MIVSDAAINRRITVFVSMVLIVVAGLYAYSVLPRESTPEIVIPILLVSTSYQGVAPADMESLVTIPIERKLTGLSGVKSIQSTSSEGMAPQLRAMKGAACLGPLACRARANTSLPPPHSP